LATQKETHMHACMCAVVFLGIPIYRFTQYLPMLWISSHSKWSTHASACMLACLYINYTMYLSCQWFIGGFVLANQIQAHVHARAVWNFWICQYIDVHNYYLCKLWIWNYLIYRRCRISHTIKFKCVCRLVYLVYQSIGFHIIYLLCEYQLI
jgi:hypothetical protein